MEATSKPPLSLLNFCDEVLLNIFEFLDIPELLNTSRTCHHLRSIALDPLLHRTRLHEASNRLSQSLALRPPLASLQPPTSTIYLTSTHQAARTLSRRLIAGRLNRSLSRRPSASDLVGCNILPGECCAHDKATGQIVWGGTWGVVVAPGLVGARRKIERERVKDRLRRWLATRQQQYQQQRGRRRLSPLHQTPYRNSDSSPFNSPATSPRSSPHVKSLVRRFARSSRVGISSSTAVEAFGSDTSAATCRPTRSHVSRLRSFWERVGHEAGPGRSSGSAVV
ncbi:MAG: hypothetical protein M4579_002454 [Chaenotheca gracillima]|nr:MAG: hypothetical protein M4579_002454 [Chaenotheca gracillima]